MTMRISVTSTRGGHLSKQAGNQPDTAGGLPETEALFLFRNFRRSRSGIRPNQGQVDSSLTSPYTTTQSFDDRLARYMA